MSCNYEYFITFVTIHFGSDFKGLTAMSIIAIRHETSRINILFPRKATLERAFLFHESEIQPCVGSQHTFPLKEEKKSIFCRADILSIPLFRFQIAQRVLVLFYSSTSPVGSLLAVTLHSGDRAILNGKYEI